MGLKRVEIAAAPFKSNISQVRIGQPLELVEKRGKVILGTPLPIKKVLTFEGSINGATISAGLQVTVKVNQVPINPLASISIQRTPKA